MTAAAAAVAALALPVLANAQSSVDVKMTGYGTIAGGVTDNKTLEFRHTAGESKGIGHSGDFGDLTKAGLQGELKFQNDFSVLGQLVAKRRIDGDTPGADKDLDIQVDWLYGQYQFLPSTNVRIGRLAMPTYLLSDSINVTYAAPWLHAPAHFYGTNTAETLEGAELNWRGTAGPVNLTAQALYGKDDARFFAAPSPTTTLIHGHKTSGLSVTAEYGNLLLRGGVMRSITPMYGENPTDTYTSVGLQYDDGEWLVMAEAARRRDSALQAIGDQSLIQGDYSYVAAGHRFGKFLPLVMWSAAKHQVGIAPHVRIDNEFHSIAASLRYDVASNVSLKAQWDRYGANDSIAFVNPSFTDTSKVNVFSAGLDFVF